MSAFTIFLIVVTIGYVLYYAAIITIDLNAKPKDGTGNEESVDTDDLVKDQISDDDELYDEHDSDDQDDYQQDYQENNIDNDEVDEPEANDLSETYQHEDEQSDKLDDNNQFHDDEERMDEEDLPGEEEYEEEPSQTESPGYPADLDAVSEMFEDPDESERSDVHSPVPDSTEDETITVIDVKGPTEDYEESDDFDVTELTPEQRAALIAEFQSSMDKDDTINLVEPTVLTDDDIFEDPDEEKYEVKQMLVPDDADEGDIPRAINAALEQTMPESTTPMDIGLLSQAAMGRLGVDLDGTSHYERT